jgi:hypothetical protein
MIAQRLLDTYGGNAARWRGEGGALDADGAEFYVDFAAGAPYCACPGVMGMGLGYHCGTTAEALGFECDVDMFHWNDAPERTFADVEARLRAVVAGEL